MKIPIIKDAHIFKTETTNRKSKANPETDEQQYPFDLDKVAQAYKINPYHNQAIDIKAMNILGMGFEDSFMDILEDITPDESAYTILLKTVRDIRTFGNAYWEINKIGGVQIFHIPANTVFKNEKGWIQRIGDEEVEFEPDEIFHFAEYSFLSNVYGTPDYLPVLPFVDLMNSIVTYNDNFFKGNAIPEQVMAVKGATLSPKALSAVQRFFRRAFSGVENSHKLLYLPLPHEAQVELIKLQSENKDGEFGKLFEQCVTAIIACHGVPPRLMSIMTPGALGGGGETTGQLKIFYNTVIFPRQQMFIGDLQLLAKKHTAIFGNYDLTKLELLNFENEDQAADAASVLRRL